MSTPRTVPESGLLDQVTAELAVGMDPTALLQRFLPELVRTCGAQAGAMRVLDDDERRFDLVAEQGLPAAVRHAEATVEAGCGVCGSAAGTREPTWSEDLAPCVRRSHDAFFGHGCGRVLAVPLVHRAQVLGMCNLFFAPDTELPAQVMALLKTLAGLLGLALHQARLERAHLQASLLAERRLLAAEVHDSVAQTLVFAKMRLPLLEAAVDDCDRVAARRYCADLRRAVGEAHVGLRATLRQLQAPGDLRHLLAAGRRLLHEQAAVSLEVDDRAPDLRLSGPQEHQVQRIVQEALHNIARHAAARHAWLKIERCGGELEIVVDDDGTGLPDQPLDEDGSHFGLGIMRQRAALLGGAIEFGRRAQGGTRVRLRFPLTGREAAA